NTTNNALTVGGLYLSDDITNLTKFQIPAGTVIAPNSVLPIWTDDDADQLTGIHTNFKLSSTGESVVLSNGVTPYDQVDYTAQTVNVAYARCNDGGTFTLTQPTFAALNNCHLSVNELEIFDVKVFPVPSATNFNIRSNEQDELIVTVFDLQGRIVHKGTAINGVTEINASQWNPGVYQLLLQSTNGTSKVIAVVKE
uniref:T9SS type A sorting domain-containing protein n=1 Tax=Fluviicola sp. TaxID=1917219 RepID=UPI00404AD4F5